MRRSGRTNSCALSVLLLFVASCGGGGDGKFFAAIADAISSSTGENPPPPAHWDTFSPTDAPSLDAYTGDGEPGTSQDLAVTAVVPATGTTGGGEIVTVMGQGFTPGATVEFGTTPGTDAFVQDAGSLLVMTPAHSPGRVRVRVILSDGVDATLEQGFEFVSPVEILTVDPPKGPATGGTPIEVRGSGFSGGAVLLVGGVPAIATKVLTDEIIQAITPGGAPGPADIHVTTPAGFAKMDFGYTYTSAPTVVSLTPLAGTAAGGTKLTFSGVALTKATEVWLEGAKAQVTEPGDGTTLTVLTPGGPPGPVDVLLSSEGGDTLLTGAFTYITGTSALEVWNIYPAHGSKAGGEEVFITATGLGAKADTYVMIGGLPAQVEAVDANAALVVARTPAFTSVGAVDVVVSSGGEEDVLPGGYVVEAPLAVVSVSPSKGPVAGGTPITVGGVGFGPDTQLFVGALPANAVTLVDDETITAKTPPGSGGYASVRVRRGESEATLDNAFLYTGEDGVILYAMEPTVGAIAGGTYVEIYGTGFEPGARVFFGETEALTVEVLSPVVVAAVSPPWFVQTVDITVETGGISRSMPMAYTYYNPLNEKGGTWGGRIDGSINVTVLDAYMGYPIAGAVVIVGEGPGAWVRLADDNGQTTFSKKGLVGPVKVSASKGEPPMKYSTYSVVDYDARNLTIFLVPVVPPSPGGSGSDAPAQVQGRVLGMDKYILPPPSDCAKKLGGNTGAYCLPCNSDQQCQDSGGGPDSVCASLLQPGWTLGSFCSTACNVSTDCPDGFVCAQSGAGTWCHPAPPEKKAYCTVTKDNHFGYQPPLGPDNEVGPAGDYSITTRVGEMAVVCYGGWVDEDGVFTRSIMGVKRHVLTFAGGLIDGQDVTLSIPLSHTLRARFLDPPFYEDGLGAPYFRISLQLDGEDGYIQMPETPVDQDAAVFEFPGYPEELTGPLFGSVYHMYASVYANSPTGLPYAVIFLQNIENLVGETLLASGEDGVLAPVGQGVVREIAAIWGSGSNDVYAVGPGGLILHGTAAGWWPQGMLAKSDLSAVWGTSATDVWVVGDSGTALHWDGTTWTKVDTAVTFDLRGVWGTSAKDVFAVGTGGVLHWDGAAWETLSLPHSEELTSITGDGKGDVFAVAADGKVLRRSGGAWVATFIAEGAALRGVWAADDGFVVAVGDEGSIRMRKNGAWMDVPALTARTLRGVWGTSEDNVVVVGDGGTVLRWNGAEWKDETNIDSGVDLSAVWGPDNGSALLAGGRYNLLVGPFMPFPKITAPKEGSPLTDGLISWELPTLSNDVSSVTLSDEFGSPFWQLIVDGSVDHVELPDFGLLEGLSVIPGGPMHMSLTFTRARDDSPFDIDAYVNQDLSIYRRLTWAINQVTFY